MRRAADDDGDDPRLTLGYRAAVALTDSVLAPAGTRVRGHEFHRTTADPAAGAGPGLAVERRAAPRASCTGGVHASLPAPELGRHPPPGHALRRRAAAASTRREVLSAHR